MNVVKVLLPKTKLFPLEYILPDNINVEIGDLVIVPFRNHEEVGIVWALKCDKSIYKLKEIINKYPGNYRISLSQIELIKKTAGYYLTHLGSIAKLVLPIKFPKKIKNISEFSSCKGAVGNLDKQKEDKLELCKGQSAKQIQSFSQVIESQEIPLISCEYENNLSNIKLPKLSEEQLSSFHSIMEINKPIIIKGVTGSGKTEIYFHVIYEYLKIGKQILLMLPEIALSTQIIQRFKDRFGIIAHVWNSQIKESQRKKIFFGIISGKIQIIIGTRSALFLPYKDLGLIVVDEEHDQSYKQNEGILYNARDMAILRSSLSNIKILLISATPSVETIQNSAISKYHMIEIKNQFHKIDLPSIEILDMRKEKLPKESAISSRLIELLKDNIEKKEQTLLFLNRKGYSPLIFCRSCGYRFTCNSCSVSLVVHKNTNSLKCHYCGRTEIFPSKCPNCDDQTSLSLCGIGIEKLAEQVRKLFPNQNITIFSRDHIKTQLEIEFFLSQMNSNTIDILIATQIISKGYHFPNLTLVGIIDSDIGFFGGDLRSSESCYQLLHQLTGRVGRENKRGHIVIQTYYPDNNILSSLKDRINSNFLEFELKNRKDSLMPPFTRATSITITGKDADKTKILSERIILNFEKQESVRILGPTEALIFRLSGNYRYKILIIAPKTFNIQKYIRNWISITKIPSSYKLKIDIDPYNFF